MFESTERSKGCRFPKSIIACAVYLYHRFLVSYRDVQELLFERGVDVGHETVRVWCAKFGPDLAEALRHRRPRRCRTWHLDELRVALGGVTYWLWRAVSEYGEALDVLLQKRRDGGVAKRFFRRLIKDHELPERIVTDGLRSYGAALRELPELGASERVTVSAAERQNNLIEQSHRPTRHQDRATRPRVYLRPCRGLEFLPPYTRAYASTPSPPQPDPRLRRVGRAVTRNILRSWWKQTTKPDDGGLTSLHPK